jgi:hypothetical protein
VSWRINDNPAINRRKNAAAEPLQILDSFRNRPISPPSSLAISTQTFHPQKKKHLIIMQEEFEYIEGEEVEVDRPEADREQINEYLPQIHELLPTKTTTNLRRFLRPILTLIFLSLTVHHFKTVTPEESVTFALKNWNKEMLCRGMMPIKAEQTLMILTEGGQDVLGDTISSRKCPVNHPYAEIGGFVIGRRWTGIFNSETKCHNVTRVVVSACSGGRCGHCSGLIHDDSSEKVVQNHWCSVGMPKHFAKLKSFGMEDIPDILLGILDLGW